MQGTKSELTEERRQGQNILEEFGQMLRTYVCRLGQEVMLQCEQECVSAETSISVSASLEVRELAGGIAHRARGGRMQTLLS